MAFLVRLQPAEVDDNPVSSRYTARMPEAASQEIPGLQFLRSVLEQIVEDHDQLVVEGSIDDLGVLLTVRVSDRDMGKLIGKSGQTIKALRTLLRTLGGNTAQRINLKVLEPGT